MKKMCKPKPCPCPPKSDSRIGIIGPLKFLMKAALASSLVYLTVQAGVWSEPQTSEELYYTVYRTLLPEVCQKNDEESFRNSFLDRSQRKEVCDAYQELMENVSIVKCVLGCRDVNAQFNNFSVCVKKNQAFIVFVAFPEVSRSFDKHVNVY